MKSINNKIVRIAPGSNGVSSWNGRVGAVNPEQNDYSITQIQNASTLANSANINFINPQPGHSIYFDGSQWISEMPPGIPVTSVFGRTGAITSQSNDYAINQIQNASTLANSANVNIALPSANQLLFYDGSQWTNKSTIAYIGSVSVSNTTQNAQLGYIYMAANSTIIMPTCTAGDIGKRILVISQEGYTTGVYFSPSVQFRSFADMYIDGNYGCIEFVVKNVNQYEVISSSGNFINPLYGTKPLTPHTINDLYNVNINSPQTGQILTYNGTNWTNVNVYGYMYFNSDSNLSNNNYLQIYGQTGLFERAAFAAGRAGTISSLYAKLTNAPGTGSSRTFTVYVNGVATSMVLTISDLNTTGHTTANQVSFSQYDEIAIRHSAISGPNTSRGYLTAEYF